MYIVKRAFKSVGVNYTVGSVVSDPNVIRLFKSKVKEGKIVKVDKNAENYEHIAEWFKARANIDITKYFEPKQTPPKQTVVKPATK